MEIHGGTIKAESAGRRPRRDVHDQSAGDRIGVRAPRVQRKPRTAPPRLLAPQLLSGVNVLLVDDDSDTLKLMTTALTRRQATVTAVSSAGEAIQAIQRRRPDVLVSDIAMPDEDGYGLIEKVRSAGECGEHSGCSHHGVRERRGSRTRAVVRFSDLPGEAGGGDGADFRGRASGAKRFLKRMTSIRINDINLAYTTWGRARRSC